MAALIQYANGIPAIKFSIDQLFMVIGRDEDSDICIDDQFASKRHAILEARQNRQVRGGFDFYLHDMKSTNNTFVNDEAVKRVRLKHNDVIRIGEEMFVFEHEEEPVQAVIMNFSEAKKNRQRLSRRLSSI